ncbi:MAG: 3,4-dioxygenase subunit beta [Acidimicrobiia bacterium]
MSDLTDPTTDSTTGPIVGAIAGLRSRREVLALLGGLGATVVIAGCGGGSGSSASGTTTTSNGTKAATSTTAAATTTTPAAATTATITSCAPIPEETGGPYPGDGSNGPNALALAGIVRSDIRQSIGNASGIATGVPLTVKLTVVDTTKGCAPMSGAAVYLWHCDAEGRYSMYSQGAANENYLRGVQPAASDGTLTFTTIFPAAYSGRWPHLHFQIYPSVAAATSATGKLRTTQLALPADADNAVYGANSEYRASIANMARTSLSSDMVFSDGVGLQTPTMSGNATSGYTATLLVGI